MKKSFQFATNLIIISLFILLTNSIVYAEHNHTNECYAGTKHICDGNSSTYGLCYSTPIYHEHKDECFVLTCPATNVQSSTNEDAALCSICQNPYTLETKTCNDCGANISHSSCSNVECENYVAIGELQHNTLTIERAKELNLLICEKNETNIESYEKTCKKEDGMYYYGSEKVNAICDKIAINISPVSSVQISDNPNLNIIVTFLDGHTEETQPTSSSYLSSMVYNNAQIKLNYYGLINNASTYDNLLTTITLTTPTQIPTIIETPTPTTVPTIVPTTPIPTEVPTIVEPTPTTTIILPTETIVEENTPTITQTPTSNISPEDVIGVPTNNPPPTIIPKVDNNSSNDILIVVAIIIIVILLIVGCFLIMVFYKQKEDELEDEFDDLDEEEIEEEEIEEENNDIDIESKTIQY